MVFNGMELLMKTLLLTLILLLSLKTYTQEIVPALTVNKNGVAPQIHFQQVFVEGDFKFGPRAGFTVHALNQNANHFYLQNIVEYKNVFLSPFWLRRYDKSIGYQVPFSIGYHFKTEILDGEVWLNYVYHARTIDLHIVIMPINYRFRLD
jgi:hypothetical protein